LKKKVILKKKLKKKTKKKGKVRKKQKKIEKKRKKTKKKWERITVCGETVIPPHHLDYVLIFSYIF